ncbi:hypothetical protein [Sphingomonas hengshuiensis]|uniref:Uncharacterized protein n=1 Tax=Sphingomonas hengshuiensis TaxID=1609977 RepID=A0A7U4LG40_9SPHN|nr:hypothetical protein [Sphingomonas hengshuiensis]AJP72913.1 hypothetical protein TS85_15635 [Sphingomonas hengshuiensis]
MSKLDEAVAAAIDELHRQAEVTGCTTEDNGELAQVDGSFKVRPLVRAILASVRDPSEDMRYMGCLNHPPADAAGIWRAMIDQLLNEDRV